MLKGNAVDRPDRSNSVPIFVRITMLIIALTLQPVMAGMVKIEEGSSVFTGSGQIDLGCGDAEIAGSLAGSLIRARDLTFSPGASTSGASLSLSGNWINNGPRALNALVDWRDGCGVTESIMLGNSDVTALHITSDSGREIRIDTDGEQRVSDSLSLIGSTGHLLRLRPTSAHQFARLSLNFGGSQMIDSVDVARIDSSAGQDIAPGMPGDYNSLRSGPVRNWFLLPAVPVSTLGVTSTVLLILLMGLLGLFCQHLRK